MESQGSLGHEMIATEDLPGIGADETPSDVAAVGTTQNDGELELAVALTPKDWFVRCDVGDRTLAECASLYDTYCSASGTLHSDDITCRFDCSVSTIQSGRWRHGTLDIQLTVLNGSAFEYLRTVARTITASTNATEVACEAVRCREG